MKEKTIKELKKLRGKEIEVTTKNYAIIKGILERVGKKEIQLFRYAWDTPIIEYSDIISMKEVSK